MTSVRTTGSRSSGARREPARRASTTSRARREVTPTRRRDVTEQPTGLRVAAGRVRRLRPGWLGVVLGGGALMFVLFMVAVAGTLVISEQAHIDRTNARIARAEARAEELRVELAQLKSPQYVTTRAATVLGMIPAPTPVYLQPRPSDDDRAAELPPVTAASRSASTARPSGASTPSVATTGTTTGAR